MYEPILMKFGTQQQIENSMTVTLPNITFFFKFKMADGRHVEKYWKYHKSPANRLIGTQLGWSHWDRERYGKALKFIPLYVYIFIYISTIKKLTLMLPLYTVGAHEKCNILNDVRWGP